MANTDDVTMLTLRDFVWSRMVTNLEQNYQKNPNYLYINFKATNDIIIVKSHDFSKNYKSFRNDFFQLQKPARFD